LFLYKLV